jgi:hypothetical protein
MKTNITKLLCTLALLGAAASAPAGPSNPLTLNYSGYFGPTTTLGGTTFSEDTAFSMAATFDAAATPITSGLGFAGFSASSFSIVIGSTTYAASSPADLAVMLADQSGPFEGLYAAGISDASFGHSIFSVYAGATPALDANNPTATVFSGYKGSDRNTGFAIALTDVTGGLVINDLGSGDFTANLTSVPEPSQWAIISCFGVLGLVYVAKRRLAKAAH